MQTYLESIRNSALSLLDGTRAWDGGIFQLVGEHSILYNAVAGNQSFDRRVIVADAKSTLLSGGTLTAIAFTLILILSLLAVIIVSICCRWRIRNRRAAEAAAAVGAGGGGGGGASSRRYAFGGKLQSRVKEVSQRLPVSLRLLLGVVCGLVLCMALVPLVLSFAANSRLHASVSERDASRQGTVAYQIDQAFNHIDAFLARLVPDARVNLAPVIDRTLSMTAAMKAKSQAAYQGAFRDAIGATTLTNASTELLDRIGIYYYAGKRFENANTRVNRALNNLQHTSLQSYESDCRRYTGSAILCRNHTDSIDLAQTAIRQVHANWTQGPGSTPLTALFDIAKFLGDLVGTLDATDNTPEKQQRLKEQKVNVSIEFNRNISSVFERELNSTEFVLNGVEEKLSELEAKIDSARDSLRNASARVQARYASSSGRFERLRFGATTILLVLMLATLVCLATETVVILLMPSQAKARSCGLAAGVYASYAAYALMIAFVCLLFCLTSYMQTEACRYLYEGRTADKYLVPQVNAVILDMKARAAADPNRTDSIPLTGVGRLIGGLLEGCQANQPIVQALDAVRYIDTEASNSAEASLAFKLKGRDILRREMSSANLEVLRDTSMENKMQSLRAVFAKYNGFDFTTRGGQLVRQMPLLHYTQDLLKSLKVLNAYIHSKINDTEGSTWKLSKSNQADIELSLESIVELLNATHYVDNQTPTLESRKNVVAVIGNVISANRRMDTYLANQTLWTDTAADYYTQHVIDGSLNESKAVADATTIGFLSNLAHCGDVYKFYTAFIGVPCQDLLYPLSILWFCIAWFLWFGVLFALLVHLSLACYVGVGTGQKQQLQSLPQHQPIDDSMPMTAKPAIRVSNGGDAALATTGTEDLATADPLLSKA